MDNNDVCTREMRETDKERLECMMKSKKIREIVAMIQKDIEKSLQDIQEGKCISADEYEKGIAIETVTKFAKSAGGKIDSKKIALASQKLAKFGYTAEEVASAIATVTRKLQPPGGKEILLISQNPTLNRKQKRKIIIREIRRKNERRTKI